jgi:hypothetical protein
MIVVRSGARKLKSCGICAIGLAAESTPALLECTDRARQLTSVKYSSLQALCQSRYPESLFSPLDGQVGIGQPVAELAERGLKVD